MLAWAWSLVSIYSAVRRTYAGTKENLYPGDCILLLAPGASVCVCMRACVCMHTCMCVCTYVHVCVCMRACVCMHTCMCMCVCVNNLLPQLVTLEVYAVAMDTETPSYWYIDCSILFSTRKF